MPKGKRNEEQENRKLATGMELGEGYVRDGTIVEGRGKLEVKTKTGDIGGWWWTLVKGLVLEHCMLED